jgi:hypothetical protein
LPYASRFFFIKKKNRRYRLVQDYHNLNKWMVPNKYPLPLISDLIHNLSGKKWYTKFDVHWGYNNVHIKEGDEWKAVFKTSEGLFEPTVMFFGLTNSPATFQTMVDDDLKEEIASGDFNIYMDDGVIHTDGMLEEHERYCHTVFLKLEQLDLFLKPEKCFFSQPEVEYLGMIVSNGQVKMDPVKVQGIADWQRPTTVKEVHSFLGFCNFYHTFIWGFSHIAHPLNDLTKKLRTWDWTSECENAFLALKQSCTTHPVLRTPDWNHQFILDTDASGYALGVVISQEHDDGLHPVAFHSHSLLPAEVNYNTHNKELLGVIFGFKCGHPLFLGVKHPICICTDHKNLQYFHELQKVMGHQAWWIQFLQNFDYTLEHIPGASNMIADLLSWRSDLNKGVNSDFPHILLPDTLFSTRKIYLEDDPTLQRQVLWNLYDSPFAGHPGITNIWELVQESYKGPRL